MKNEILLDRGEISLSQQEEKKKGENISIKMLSDNSIT